jgi:5-methylcytosine-specific restriction endonuclease McrA
MTSCHKFCKKCDAVTERYKDGVCKACSRAKNNAWAARNRSTLNARCRQWNANNAEAKRATNARYREKHQKAVNERRKIKRALDPSIEKNKTAKRRAAKGVLPKNIVNTLLIKQQNKCNCCGEFLGNAFHLDHIIPIARGGTNTEDNVQLLLQKCNQQKYTLTMQEFLAKRRNKQLPTEMNGVINTPLG